MNTTEDSKDRAEIVCWVETGEAESLWECPCPECADLRRDANDLLHNAND